MRLLFVTPTLPVPTSGGRTRLYHLARSMSSRHRVAVVSLIQPGEKEVLARTPPCCQRLELVPFEGYRPVGRWSNRLRGWRQLLFSQRPPYTSAFPVEELREPLHRLLEQETPDVVLFDKLFVAELATEAPDTPKVLAEDNVESDIARQARRLARNPVHRARNWLVWRRLLEFERHWLPHFSLCVAVTPKDATLLQQLCPGTPVRVVPNGVDSRFFSPPVQERDPQALLFFGTLSYGPNVDGLTWFCEQILPRVRHARPGVTLEVVGLHLPPRIQVLGNLPGVQITGFVPDIRAKLWGAGACVVPLHAGGGTRLKILEALAAGCPVVSTSIGADGLSLVKGEHLLVEDSAQGFAQALLHLIDSPAERERLAEAGREAVARRYDWLQIAPLLEAACAEAIGMPRMPATDAKAT